MSFLPVKESIVFSPEFFIELDRFRNVMFREDIHKYFIDGVQCPLSTTGLIGKFYEHFNEEYWSEKKAEDYCVDRESVLRVWKYLNKHAITEGKTLHSFAELMMNSKIYAYPETDIREQFEGIDPIRSSYLMMQEQFTRFHRDIKGKLIPIKSELVIGDPEWMLGGMIDQIFWNTTAKEIQIWDWKTNTKLERQSDRKMLYPIDYVPDCNLYHYYLQLTIYKYIIERNTRIKIGKMYIVWFNERNADYQIIPIVELREEVQKMIDYEILKKY